MAEKFEFILGRVENIVGKGENGGYQHFLLFPQCFQKASILGSLKSGLCGKESKQRKNWICLNSLLNDKNLDAFELKAFAEDKINVTVKLKFGLRRVENIVGKVEKCWLPAFSPFPTMFSKDLCFRVVKSQDCVVKS